LELQKEARESGDNWEHLAEKVGESIPIFGAFFSAGLNIRELFTGEKAAMEEVEAELKETAHVMAEHKSLMQQAAEQAKEYRETLRGIAQEFALLGKSGFSLKLQQISNETENKVADALKGNGKYAGLKPEQIKPYEDALKLIRSMGGRQPHIMNNAEAEEKLQRDFASTKQARQGFELKIDQDMIDKQIEKSQKLANEYTNAILLARDYKKIIQDANSQKGTVAFNQQLLGGAKAWDLFKQEAKDAFGSAAHDVRHFFDIWDTLGKGTLAARAKDIKEWKDKALELNLTPFHKALADDARKLGADPGGIRRDAIGEYFRQDSIRQNKEWQDRNKREQQQELERFREGLLTPVDKFKNAMFEMNRWLHEGKITPREFEAGKLKAQRDSFGNTSDRAPLIRAGSAEGQQLQYLGMTGAQPDKSLPQLAQSQLTALQKLHDDMMPALQGIAGAISGAATKALDLVF
ncbi:MAG: hypothetical protein WCI73_14185, partial [Phycisphaerae bacterium]